MHDLPGGAKRMVKRSRGIEYTLVNGEVTWEKSALTGAAAFADMFATWWVARNDFTAIPFGEIEGVGTSDSVRLTQEHGWATEALVRRYATVGVSCLAALTLAYAWGVRQAWFKAREACAAKIGV